MRALRFVVALAGAAAVAVAVVSTAVLLLLGAWAELGKLPHNWIPRLGLIGICLLLIGAVLRPVPDLVRGFRTRRGRL